MELFKSKSGAFYGPTDTVYLTTRLFIEYRFVLLHYQSVI